jgi:hypothetical protein
VNPIRYKTWSPPAGLVIQPGGILVPGRAGYVGYGWTAFTARDNQIIAETIKPAEPNSGLSFDSSLITRPVSVIHWDLSSLTEAEIDGLQVAIDEQRNRGVGSTT